MLKLKNIKRNNGIISAEYDPENSGKVGAVSIDVENGKVVESVVSSYDADFPIYLNHAIESLKKLKDDPKLPQEKLVMWH